MMMIKTWLQSTYYRPNVSSRYLASSMEYRCAGKTAREHEHEHEQCGISATASSLASISFRASGVCRLWHRLSNLPSLWEAQCRGTWRVFNHAFYQHDWKAIYRDSNMQTKEGEFSFKLDKFLQLGPTRICSPVYILADTRWYAHGIDVDVDLR